MIKNIFNLYYFKTVKIGQLWLEDPCVCVLVCTLKNRLALSDSRRTGIHVDSVVVSPSVHNQPFVLCVCVCVYVCHDAALPDSRWPMAP